MTTEFFDWFDATKPALEKWGEHVVQTVKRRVKDEVGEERFVSFFKIETSLRVKSKKSIEDKILKKLYSSPRDQVTDLIGARFVVLLKSDLDILDRAIINRNSWAVSKDRDFFNESLKEPSVFDYQSNHYVVTSVVDQEIEGVFVPSGLRCEVQSRSLLQHAYAELVHADVYKANNFVPESTKRLVARSMALMESTDEVFLSISRELEGIRKAQSCLYSASRLIYLDMGVEASESPTSLYLEVADTYRDLLEKVSLDSLSAVVVDVGLRKKIKERSLRHGLFSDPTALLAYWLMKNNYRRFFRDWPRHDLRSDLEQIAADNGLSFPD
ncbi:hypothetical protein DUD43_09060 [Alcaligenes faecalis]|uniref:GTP pyrophosphokinase n=1 Tax=Alcaligenes faecalis TaxID=511 RepID=UPI0012935102|nr:hypothetical protein [Alcaligenes faecalis]QFY77819.1 hypothetical protein DUD43_09060 [Alcaligenes faecalis]